MTQARIYPKADARTQWWEPAFTRGTFDGIEKVLLHTTETGSWPGYAGGSMAPTLTYHPRLRAWRQHCNLNRSARALVDPAGTLVRENRDNVIQVEIVAYADEPLARSRGHLPVSELTDAQLGDLAEFIAFVRAEWGGPPLVAARFLPYPQSAGDSPVRMSGPAYDAFRGVLGHQHASGNGHGDPGALNVPRILQLAGAATKPAPAPTPAPLISGGLSMADIDTLTAQLNALTAAVNGFRSEESGRYVVDANRYKWMAGALGSIAGKVGVDLDEAAIAKAVLAGLTPQVTAAVKAAVAQLPQGAPAEELAAAVVAQLGAKLT